MRSQFCQSVRDSRMKDQVAEPEIEEEEADLASRLAGLDGHGREGDTPRPDESPRLPAAAQRGGDGAERVSGLEHLGAHQVGRDVAVAEPEPHEVRLRLGDEPALAAQQLDQQIRRVVLCSGKVYYDLIEARRKASVANVAIVRMEQFYPFPGARLREVLAKYPAAKQLVWAQEEPKNMGGWTFIEPRLEKLLTSRTKLVAITHMSNMLGTVVPVKEVVRLEKVKRVVELVERALERRNGPVTAPLNARPPLVQPPTPRLRFRSAGRARRSSNSLASLASTTTAGTCMRASHSGMSRTRRT